MVESELVETLEKLNEVKNNISQVVLLRRELISDVVTHINDLVDINNSIQSLVSEVSDGISKTHNPLDMTTTNGLISTRNNICKPEPWEHLTQAPLMMGSVDLTKTHNLIQTVINLLSEWNDSL